MAKKKAPTKPAGSGKEILKSDTPTKSVYFYVDKKNGIEIKSREVFKKSLKIVHYPFSKKSGEQKYPGVDKVTYVGFRNLPRGFLKDFHTGLGFTKIYNSLIYRILKKYKVSEISIGKKNNNQIDGAKLSLNSNLLDEVYPEVGALFKKQKKEKEFVVDAILSKLFPKKGFDSKGAAYVAGRLGALIRTILAEKNAELSDRDIKAIFDILATIPAADYLMVNRKKVLATKDEFEKVYVEDVLKKFDKLLQKKVDDDKLEKAWQSFFKEHSWIFTQLFIAPVIFFDDEAYVGGKDISYKGGKVVDFLYKNDLTKNVALIEIKTHKKSLLKKKPYRGKDVFSQSNDLSGGLNQVLDQRDSLQKEFYSLSKGGTVFNAYNPKCVLVIGSISELTQSREKAFELIRSNSSDVEIITFDEIYNRIKGLQKILGGNRKI